MRRLSPGDVEQKLGRIRVSKRTDRWKRRARRHLLKDQKASCNEGSSIFDIESGKVCEKRRFPTFSAAMIELIELQRSTETRRKESRVYPCSHCQAWHLTSKDMQ